ncbi:MAG TPA: hypothetical protein PLR59_14000, partial [Brevundimonas sp.]|nr:hypothetical protein [Brevundimonas sp.]
MRMTVVRAFALSVALLSAAPVAAQAVTDSGAEQRIEADVVFLADDALEGRGTGQRGYDLAALYVQSRMQAIGLRPGAAGGDWLQRFTVARLGIAAEGATLSWTPAGGEPVVWRSGQEALFGVGREAGRFVQPGQLVFVGFGIDAPELGMSDYADLDVAGKIVVFLSGAPAGTAPEVAERLEAAKARTAEARGAIGTVTVNTAASAGRYTDTLLRRFAGRTETVWVGPDGTPRRQAP